MRYVFLTLTLIIAPLYAVADDSDLLTSIQQQASLDSEGRLDAVVVTPRTLLNEPVPGESKLLFSASDEVVIRAKPLDDSGLGFTLDNLTPGDYSMVSKGPNFVGCYFVHVSDPSGDGAVAPLQITVADLDILTVRKALIRYMPASIDEIEASASTSNPPKRRLVSLSDARVALGAGGLAGQIYGAGSAGGGSTNVMIYKNRELVGQAVTDDDGKFSVPDLAVGEYSVIAVGPSGLGITSFELVNDAVGTPDLASDSDEATHLVSMQQPAQLQLQLELAPSGLDSPIIQELISEENNPAGALGGGGMPYQSFGGGGGGAGAGVGGGGAMIGLAGLAIGVAALANDDDDLISVPPVSSPLTP